MTARPITVTVVHASQLTDIGQSTIRHAIDRGEIETRRNGRKLLVLYDSLEQWVKGLPQERSAS